MKTNRKTLVLCLALALLLGLASSAWAQAEGTTLLITRLDTDALPRLDAYVMAFDANGLPITDLTADDFALTADDASLTVEAAIPSSDQARRLVLAVDTSTPPDTLARIVADLERFIEDELTPRDQVALMAFDHEIQLVQDFTADKTALRAALRTLTSRETYTALHETVIRAVTKLDRTFDDGYKAVIVIVDIQDNMHRYTLDEAIAKAQAAHIPVHVVAFGPKIRRPAELRALGTATGGLSFVLERDTDVAEHLRLVGLVIRQGYRLTTHLTGTTLPHTLHVSLREGEADAEAILPTPAAPRPTPAPAPVLTVAPIVNDLTLPAQQPAFITVTGDVRLGLRITTPVQSVDYYLDGEPLALGVSPDDAIIWDSGSEPYGVHILTIKAVAPDGRIGQMRLSLNSVPPIQLNVTLSTETPAPGEPLTVTVEASAVAGLASVELLLDGESIARRGPSQGGSAHLAAPARPRVLRYHFTVETAGLEGTHTLTVRATDVEGHHAEVERIFRIADTRPWYTPSRWWESLRQRSPANEAPAGPPWYAPQRRWVQIAVLTLALLLLLLAILLLVVIIINGRKHLRWQCRLRFRNLGNAPTAYEVRAGDTEAALAFDFLLRGNPLPVVEELAAEEAAAEEAPSEAAPTASAKGGPTAWLESSAELVQRTQKKIGKATRFSLLLSSLLVTVGNILGPMGKPFVAAGREIRRQQARAMRIVRVPERKLRSARMVERQLRRLRRRPTTSAAPPEPQADAATQLVPLAVTAWSRTPTVAPGEVLTFDLVVRPLKRLGRHRARTFTLFARPVGTDRAPIPITDLEAVTTLHIVRFRFGIPWLRLYLPLLLCAILILALIAFILWWLNYTASLALALLLPLPYLFHRSEVNDDAS